jgi:acetylglutamate kinase
MSLVNSGHHVAVASLANDGPAASRWLLNLDGHVAAYRLAQLLAANSLVLKQESLQHEYYYK